MEVDTQRRRPLLGVRRRSGTGGVVTVSIDPVVLALVAVAIAVSGPVLTVEADRWRRLARRRR